MANKMCEVNSICRLCLGDDNEVLFSMSCIIDSSLTEEDIERFTGIELFGEENISYRICIDCANKLKKCALFRTLCLSCDVQFKRMFASNSKECFSTTNDSATVELSVEPYEPAIQFETVDIKNVHRIEESTVGGNEKESKVDLALEEPPEDDADDDNGLEVKREQYIDVITDSLVIKLLEDDEIKEEDANSTSQNKDEDEGQVSPRKLPKCKTSLNAKTTTSETVRKYSPCDTCGRMVSDIESHLLTHRKDEKFACPHCPHRTRFRKDLNAHIKTVHRKETCKTCVICGTGFVNYNSYKNHMASQHSADEYECEPCSKKFSHARTYNIHVRRYHQTDWMKKNPKQLCGTCGAMVTNIDSHMLTHTQERKHSCPHCPLKMVDAGNLARHVQSVHLKKPVRSCEICNMGFKYPSSHRSHMLRIHGIGNTFDCRQCSKKFNHQSGLAIHVLRAHSNVKKYACKTCGMEFKIGRNLLKHQMVHSTEQPYECNQCPKRFKSKHARNTHQLTHSGIVFSCSYCEKSYRYKAVLAMHIRQKHPETMTVNTSA